MDRKETQLDYLHNAKDVIDSLIEKVENDDGSFEGASWVNQYDILNFIDKALHVQHNIRDNYGIYIKRKKENDKFKFYDSTPIYASIKDIYCTDKDKKENLFWINLITNYKEGNIYVLPYIGNCNHGSNVFISFGGVIRGLYISECCILEDNETCYTYPKIKMSLNVLIDNGNIYYFIDTRSKELEELSLKFNLTYDISGNDVFPFDVRRNKQLKIK